MLPSDVSIALQEVVCHIDELEDLRSTINRLHPLPSVLTFSLIGALAGAKGPTGIAKWAVAKKHLPGKESFAMKRQFCGWSDDFVMQVLGIADS